MTFEQQHYPDVTEGQTVAARTSAHAGRGWGPFSGTQLTVMIVTFAIVISFPFAAFAVTGNRVFVTDSTSGKTAAVNASRQLSVNGVVSGAITATQTPPNSAWNEKPDGPAFGLVLEANKCQNASVAVPKGKALVVTSIDAELFSDTTPPAQVWVFAGKVGSPCSVSMNPIAATSVTTVGDIRNVAFPPGIAINPGHTLDVTLSSVSGDARVLVWVHGYVVPSSQCTVTAAFGSPIGCY